MTKKKSDKITPFRVIRGARGVKQKYIADKVGIDKVYLSQIETGVKIPTIEVIQKIIAAYDKSSPLTNKEKQALMNHFFFAKISKS